jgi:dolichyl-diphosphooligosaccharide--protein glycosyltransferase
LALYGVDPHYHFRRAMLAVRHGLSLPDADYYSGYPHGTRCFWHPAFDNALALPAYVVWGTGASESRVWSTAVWLPPLVGVATIVVVVLLTSRLVGRWEGVAAGLAVSVLPAHIWITPVGRLDHHAAEPLFPALALLCYLTSRRHHTLAWPVLAGLAMAAGMMAWTGSTLYMLPVGLLLVVLAIVEQAPADRSWGLLSAAVTLWMAAAGTAVGYGGTSWTRAGQAPFDAPGLFQPLLFALLAAGATVMWVILRSRRRSLLSAGALALLFMVALAGLVPPLRQGLLDGARFLIKTDPWLKTIEEFQPLFSSFGRFDADWAEARLSRFAYLMPLLIILAFWRLLRSGRRVAAVAMCLPAAGAVPLALVQKRYAGIAVVAAAPVAGWLALTALRWVREARGGGVRLALIIALAALGFWPCVPELYSFRGRYSLMPPEWTEALQWLRDNTPATSFYWESTRKPEYGVMASHWGAGHWIVSVARRPAVANSFHTNVRGNRACAQMLFSKTEKELDAVMQGSGARYLLLANSFGAIHESAPQLSQDASTYVERSVAPGPTGRFVLTFAVKPEMARLAHARLYLRDGKRIEQSAGAWPPLAHYRLVYETEEKDPTIGAGHAAIKVFERVTGCRVTGRASPALDVKVEMRILTNIGRRFLYAQQCRADSTGGFELTIPYSTETVDGRTNCFGPALVTVGSDKKLLEISEQAVLEGENLVLDL